MIYRIIPTVPRITNNPRFNPTSRPRASYHSSRLCENAELPPAPSVIAGIPNEIGKFESVDD
jgi:hypothetical protein